MALPKKPVRLVKRTQLPKNVEGAWKKIILKCSECGNTFKKDEDSLKNGDIVACPICEADYTVLVKDGKIRIEDYVYESKDLGEL